MFSKESVLLGLSTLVSLAGLGFSSAGQVFTSDDQWPEFGRMLGGTENGGHPWDGEMSIKVDDPTSPVTAMFAGKTFVIRDQAFQLQEPSLRDRLHVLLSIDVNGTVAPRRQFFKTRVEDKDVPMSWLKSEATR